MPNSCLKGLHFALVYPHILYGIELYTNTNSTYLDKLTTLNNKLLRVLQKKDVTTRLSCLYKGLHTLPINLLFEKQVLLFVHNFVHHTDNMPSIFPNYMMNNTTAHAFNTRQKSDMHLDLHKTLLGQRCMSYKGAKAWNCLPYHLKTISSINKFKASLYDYLQLKQI